MRIRRKTVEYLFGRLKAWRGATLFLTKGLKNVTTEMSLHVLAYNMKRVMNILSTTVFIQVVRALAELGYTALTRSR
ncbi:transposase [Vreelandella aquamarina]|uniref:transposase n=1 Tax=Vreelandella aquamarina TaxID=77097 RepID=UPI00384E5316